MTSPLRVALRGLFWIGVYVALAMAPLVVAAVPDDSPPRSFVTELSVALGFIALVVFGLQFALVARFQRVAAPFGMDALIQYHRQIAFVALAFALAHPALLFAEDPSKLSLLNFPEAPARAKCAAGATVAMVLLALLSIFRRQLRLRYEWWQLTHGLLAVSLVGLALAHALLVGIYTSKPWQQALWIGLSAALVALLAWVRIVRPLRRRPWRVDAVRAERGNAWTLSLVPVGHAGLRFDPGQFGWLMVDRSPFSLTQHPFSFSSSADLAGRLEFTIKARGDFTNSIAAVEPGARAYVDGPYGLFTLERHEGPGFVLIAGGVGITPVISMIRTMADRGDARPVTLLYGNKDWESITFREELEALAARMKLAIVHVLEQTHEGGETGFITPELLRRRLPAGFERFRYFVCGPPPMMDAMEKALVEIGVPDAHVVTERFEMV